MIYMDLSNNDNHPCKNTVEAIKKFDQAKSFSEDELAAILKSLAGYVRYNQVFEHLMYKGFKYRGHGYFKYSGLEYKVFLDSNNTMMIGIEVNGNLEYCITPPFIDSNGLLDALEFDVRLRELKEHFSKDWPEYEV